MITTSYEDRGSLREAGATPLAPDTVIPTDEVEPSVVRILSPRPFFNGYRFRNCGIPVGIPIRGDYENLCRLSS